MGSTGSSLLQHVQTQTISWGTHERIGYANPGCHIPDVTYADKTDFTFTFEVDPWTDIPTTDCQFTTAVAKYIRVTFLQGVLKAAAEYGSHVVCIHYTAVRNITAKSISVSVTYEIKRDEDETTNRKHAYRPRSQSE